MAYDDINFVSFFCFQYIFFCFQLFQVFRSILDLTLKDIQISTKNVFFLEIPVLGLLAHCDPNLAGKSDSHNFFSSSKNSLQTCDILGASLLNFFFYKIKCTLNSKFHQGFYPSCTINCEYVLARAQSSIYKWNILHMNQELEPLWCHYRHMQRNSVSDVYGFFTRDPFIWKRINIFLCDLFLVPGAFKQRGLANLWEKGVEGSYLLTLDSGFYHKNPVGLIARLMYSNYQIHYPIPQNCKQNLFTIFYVLHFNSLTI